MNSILLATAVFAVLPNLQMVDAGPHRLFRQLAAAAASADQPNAKPAVSDRLPATHVAQPDGPAHPPARPARAAVKVQRSQGTDDVPAAHHGA